MYIYIYIYIYIYTHTHTHSYIHREESHTCVNARRWVSSRDIRHHVCVYLCVCLCMSIYRYHAQTYTRKHAQTHRTRIPWSTLMSSKEQPSARPLQKSGQAVCLWDAYSQHSCPQEMKGTHWVASACWPRWRLRAHRLQMCACMHAKVRCAM